MGKSILLIDNYDSFSYNLFQMFGAHGARITVIRNDEKTPEQIRQLGPDGIVLSPGPGRPEDAGCCVELVKELGKEIPIFGVCLGHQAICVAYGGAVSQASRLMHGKQSMIRIKTDTPLFSGLPERIPAARYHSLTAVRENLPECLRIAAETQEGEIMAVSHRTDPVYGVQFHPESILTPDGENIIRNFMEVAGR